MQKRSELGCGFSSSFWGEEGFHFASIYVFCVLLVNPLLGSVSSLEHGGTGEGCEVSDRHTAVG